MHRLVWFYTLPAQGYLTSLMSTCTFYTIVLFLSRFLLNIYYVLTLGMPGYIYIYMLKGQDARILHLLCPPPPPSRLRQSYHIAGAHYVDQADLKLTGI